MEINSRAELWAGKRRVAVIEIKNKMPDIILLAETQAPIRSGITSIEL